VVIYQPEPEFTKEAKKAKVQGVVTVSLVVDEHGQPQNVHIVRGMGIGPDGRPDPKLKKACAKKAGGRDEPECGRCGEAVQVQAGDGEWQAGRCVSERRGQLRDLLGAKAGVYWLERFGLYGGRAASGPSTAQLAKEREPLRSG